jgi:hypothetical protein
VDLMQGHNIILVRLTEQKILDYMMVRLIRGCVMRVKGLLEKGLQ